MYGIDEFCEKIVYESDSVVNKPLHDVMSELEEYNKQHGTLLSYGQFISMKYVQTKPYRKIFKRRDK